MTPPIGLLITTQTLIQVRELRTGADAIIAPPVSATARGCTWTGHTILCRSCGRIARVAQEAINAARPMLEDAAHTITDAEVAATFEYCLWCVSRERHEGEHVKTPYDPSVSVGVTKDRTPIESPAYRQAMTNAGRPKPDFR